MIVTCAGDPITVSNNFDRLVIVTCAADPVTVSLGDGTIASFCDVCFIVTTILLCEHIAGCA